MGADPVVNPGLSFFLIWSKPIAWWTLLKMLGYFWNYYKFINDHVVKKVRIYLKISFRAMRKDIFSWFGFILPSRTKVWCSVATDLAQSPRTFLRPLLDFPANCIFSAIFSQTLGTAKNLVGRTLFKFSTWKNEETKIILCKLDFSAAVF